MAYTRDEPTDVDVGVSRPILAANTNQADDSFGIDHVKFSVSTNAGYHHYIHLDAAYDGSAGITAPTGDITNIFATNTLAENIKPLPVFRNATGVCFSLPVAAFFSFEVGGTYTTDYLKLNAGTLTYTAAAGVYTYKITFSKALANDDYAVIPFFSTLTRPTITKTTTYVQFAFNSVQASGPVMIIGLISSLT